MLKFILINGPPRSGKDSAADMLRNRALDVLTNKAKFSDFVKLGTHGAYGLYNDYGEIRGVDYYEGCKDEPNEDFFGLTPREAWKTFSECWMKPIHGQDVFGRMLLLRRLIPLEEYHTSAIKGLDRYVLIPDSGFEAEAVPLIEYFGADNFKLIRLHRPGYTFEIDSRSYIDLSNYGVPTFDVQSPNGDLEGLFNNLKAVLPEMFQ